MVYIICIIIGISTAFVGSLVGLGGGVILIPSLLLLNQSFDMFSWATPQAIVGISLFAMIFTSLSSTLTYYKSGRVDYKTGLWFLFGSIPGGVIGSWLNQFVDTDSFLLYFGMLMILITGLFSLKRRQPSENAVNKYKKQRTFEVNGFTYNYSISVWQAIVLSLLVGTLSGLFGIGGGSIMVPAMILLFGIPTHIATATSMFIIFFTSLIGASTHVMLGHIAWEYLLFFIPGAWIGGRLGAKTNQILRAETLEKILRILLIIIGIRMIVDSLL
ncbi:TSUP family transporter [Ornithinibacillus sp. L9]|uniref:Probable membrane transporter protein n=1 Tax=Ornithinibacillus caprae TaxID=2678566 RepID=A0A6N8FMN1_9BACI|nr:sulfite exporter TauE/SafE family protein [Ornithinibacillus caprae]MUK89996.1 TSUP family transporter [Ornithinibacillus caprae]